MGYKYVLELGTVEYMVELECIPESGYTSGGRLAYTPEHDKQESSAGNTSACNSNISADDNN